MLKRNVTKDIKKEGKLFTPNVIDKVYESLGMSYVKADAKIEKNLKKEGKAFVPNVKESVYAATNVKQRNKLTGFLLKPYTLATLSAALVCGVALAIVLPNLNKSVPAGETASEETNINDEENANVLLAPSTVNMKITSASETYTPAVIYGINQQGKVSLNNVVTLNNDALNIINNLDTDFSNRAIVSSYDVQSFTNKFLSTALNLGYLERQDATKTNKIEIEFIFDESDESYISAIIESINNNISSFIYENRVITTYTCEQSKDQSGDVNSEIVALIRTAYELATKLFVTSEGKTVKVLCFSTDFADWVDKYKNSTKEELQEYIDFLKYIDEMISDDSMKESFMIDLENCSLYQEAIYDIENRYNSLSQKYEEILSFYNTKFNEHRPNMLAPLGGGWDWWDDFGHSHPHGPHDGPHDGPHYMHRPDEEDIEHNLSLDDYNEFLDLIKNDSYEFDDNSKKEELDDLMSSIEYTCDALSMFHDDFNFRINEDFEGLIYRVDNGEFFDENRPPFDDHFQPEPEDWDIWFEEWWELNY